ncbi:MAG: sulfatase-like hydrolase/transferase [Deltaproteobacteria bacterium]|nr:sulfatase-like hydrolase/transferase [Deltaproteobacteria bacterium]
MAAKQTSSDEARSAPLVRSALGFTLAAAALFFYDFGCASLSHEGNFDSLGCFLHALPQMLIAIPVALGLIVLATTWARRWLRERPGPVLLWSLVGDLLPAAVPLTLVPPLFSGAAIAASVWRWPLMLGTMMATFGAVWLLLRITDHAARWIAKRQSVARAIALLAALVATAASVVALHQTTARVLPGLYPQLHLGLTLTALAFVASFAYVLLATLEIHPNPRRTAIALAITFAISFPAGLLAAHNYPLSNQLLLEHSPFSPTYLGQLFRTEHRILRLLKIETAFSAASSTTSNPPLWNARFVDGSPRRSVLLVTVDSLRGDVLDPGSDLSRYTPKLRKLSRRFVTYERAYAPASHTTRSIPSLLAGRFVQNPSALHLEDLVSRAFIRGGYRTECFFTAHKLPVAATRLRHLISAGFAFERHHFEQTGVDEILPLVREALTRNRQPVFVWVHLIDTHSVFYERPKRPRGTKRITYEDQVAHLDRALAPFIAEQARKRPEMIWALSSDHGDARGEHGMHHHGGIPYDEQVRVPLLIGGGGVRPASVAAPATILDLPATLLHLAGAELDESAHLLPLNNRDRSKARDAVFTVGGSACALIAWPWKLIADPGRGSLELYNLQQDPGERSNTVMAEQRRAIEMLEELGRTGCPADLSVFPRL